MTEETLQYEKQFKSLRFVGFGLLSEKKSPNGDMTETLKDKLLAAVDTTKTGKQYPQKTYVDEWQSSE